MMATDDIKAGEVIVSVPRKFLITADSLSKMYHFEKRNHHALSSHQLLSLHLVLLKRDKQSWWKPYIDLLPLHFNTMPVKYTQMLIDHLPISLKEETLQQKENIHNDYLACIQYLKSIPDKAHLAESIQFDEYEWAWLCVNTRCIHMSIMDHVTKGGNIALAPMLDFLNHTTEAKIESGFNVKNNCFEIKTLTDYKKGEQVFINYGPHDNSAILREYGFVLPENTYNFVLLDHEVWEAYKRLESKRGLEIKKQILEGAGYSGDYSINANEISFRLMAALRLLALNGATEPGFDRRVMDWHDVVMGQTDIINIENERKALIILQNICNQFSKQAEQEMKFLSNISEEYPEAEFHPFALYFSRQIWKESYDIVQQIVLDLSEKLTKL
ncbi:uncharacterized protein BX663DRAFT_518015 [Cokeromyces recurvatus]|uniref:uncharacterized protein n=1 Tax=Cokeromyces recurvatus TaxID=90255 RepID=UPI00221F6754|nr:uncharacterized protein BX663DRAFT_518015 [Cokeromyces recurvatus]KAI7900247.1 hypothetical protein BX663DRAFT_518015 [Cokeromyces recurvatus]